MVRPRDRTILALLLIIALLAGCSGGTQSGANPNAQYFTGKDGVAMTFENVPSRLYYYGVEDTSGNEFTFGVNVQNKGASFTRGGIYLSGFDPDFIVFEGMNLQSHPRACGIQIGHIGFGDFAAAIQCENFGAVVQEGRGITDIEISSLGEIISALSEEHGKRWLDTNLDFSVDYSDRDGGKFALTFNDLQNRIDYYQHGRLFIYLLAGIDFKLNYGQEFLLAGDTYEFPGGESEYITYRGKIVSWPPGSDQVQQHLLLTSCYQYTTYADPIICVDPDPIGEGRKVCVPKSRTWSGGNGAPVAITSIEQENTPKNIIFRINVKNLGTGQVYDPGKLAKCSPYYPGRVTLEDLNVVYLGDVRIGQTGLRTTGSAGGITCYPEVIRLDPKTKSGTTTCTYPLTGEVSRSAYQTPLTVELWYGYSETLQRTITIKRAI